MMSCCVLLTIWLGATPAAEATPPVSTDNWIVLLRLHEALADNAKLAPIVGPTLEQAIQKTGGHRLADQVVEDARTALNLAEVAVDDLPNLLDSVGAQHALLITSRDEANKIIFSLERYDRIFELATSIERSGPSPQAPRTLRQALQELLAKPRLPRSKSKATAAEPAAERLLGVRLATLLPIKAKELGLKRPQGALVAEVMPNRAAAEAGMQAEDVLLTLGRVKLRGAFEVPARLFALPAEGPLQVEVWRGGERLKLELFAAPAVAEPVDVATSATDSPPPTGTAATKPGPATSAPAGPPRQLGARLRAVTPELANSLGLMGPTGALIVSVPPGSIAAAAGLLTDDVVLTFNAQPVTHASQLGPLVRDSAPRLRVSIEIWRKKAKTNLMVVFPEPKPAPTPTVKPATGQPAKSGPAKTSPPATTGAAAPGAAPVTPAKTTAPGSTPAAPAKAATPAPAKTPATP